MRLSIIGLVTSLLAASSAIPAAAASATFNLHLNPAVANCVAASDKFTPTAKVKVVQGSLNDKLTVTLSHVKANLALDLFTVQNSPFDSAGNPVTIPNFGLAWYQSDVEANRKGSATVTIQTILVNQIFGFDPAVALAPTNTFHVGLWFDNPADAAACNFNVNNPTPFNGEHHAGPVAFISLPIDNPDNPIGPLCFSPSSTPGVCNP
jgi:hypothetical protein